MILKEANADAVFLSQWLLYDQLRSVLALSNRRIWEGTMLAKRSCMPVYPSLPKEEDTLMVAMQLNTQRSLLLLHPLFMPIVEPVRIPGEMHISLACLTYPKRFLAMRKH